MLTKNSSSKLFCALAGLALFALACKPKAGSTESMTDPDSGITYQIIQSGSGTVHPNDSDLVDISVKIQTSNDSVLYSSSNRPGAPDTSHTVRLPIIHAYKGALTQGLKLLVVGDSANFKLHADSLYLKTFGAAQLPNGVKPGSMLNVKVKLLRIETAAQSKSERAKKIHVRELTTEQLKTEEPNTIKKYLQQIRYVGKPSPNGMFILAHEKGTGKPIKETDSVEVEYSARLLDGLLVEHSNLGPGHTSYFVAFKKEAQLPGIEQVLGQMSEGEKIRVLLPSALCFGKQQQGPLIGPYTPLIFDIKVVKVKAGKK